MLKIHWLFILAFGGLAHAQDAPVVLYNDTVLICDETSCWERLGKDIDHAPPTQSTNESAAEKRQQTPSVISQTFEPNSLSAKARTQEEKDRAKRDLDAQEDMALWSFWMFIATAAGVGLIGWTLFETRKTANLARRSLDHAGIVGKLSLKQGRKAIRAAVDNIGVTREIGEAQTRAYLSVVDAEIVDPEFSGFAFDVIVTIKNFGQSPAFQFRWFAEPTLQYFGGNNHHAPSESDLKKIRPYDTPIVISAGTEEQIRIPIQEKAVQEIMDGRGPGDLKLVGSIELSWKDVFKRDNQATAWLRPKIDSDTLPRFRGKLMVTNHNPEKDRAIAKKP